MLSCIFPDLQLPGVHFVKVAEISYSYVICTKAVQQARPTIFYLACVASHVDLVNSHCAHVIEVVGHCMHAWLVRLHSLVPQSTAGIIHMCVRRTEWDMASAFDC